MIERIKTFSGGIVFPAVITAYGIHCIFVRQAWLPFPRKSGLFSHSSGTEIHGRAALYLGASYLALSLAMHFGVFWVLTDRVRKWNELAMITCGGFAVIAFACGSWKVIEGLF